jgi:hypothetical protein
MERILGRLTTMEDGKNSGEIDDDGRWQEEWRDQRRRKMEKVVEGVVTTGGGRSDGNRHRRRWGRGDGGNQRWRGRRNDDGNIDVDRLIGSHSIHILDMV